MNKRKTSADKSSRQKASSRRPSVSSLQQKPLKPEKLPSMHGLVDPSDPSKITNKAADVSLPKTRFNSQDRCKEPRSCSSPRLKYFPAEKIKKLESQPPFSPKPMAALFGQQDPRQTGILYVAGFPEQCRDAGQGDAAAVQQHQHLQSEGVQSASQQQVVPQQAIHQIGQMNPHSESMLSQQVSNVQSHRPFVSHGSHDYSPQRNPHVASLNPPQGPMTPQPHVQQVQPNVSVQADQRKVKSEDLIGTNDLDYEKQPIGGRNAAGYRRMMIGKQQAQPDFQLSPIALSTPNVNQQNVYSQCPSHSHVPLYRNLQNPQQIYQQLQQNMAQQQQMQQKANSYQMQMMGSQQQMAGYFPSYGMISPQDVTASQMRNTRMLGPNQSNYATSHRDLNYAMNPQNRWMTNGQVAEHSSIKAQLNPYNVDVVNGNQTIYRPQNQQQQLLPPPYQQQPVHQLQMYGNPVVQNLNAHNQPSFSQQMNVNPSQQMVPLQQFNPQQPQDKHPDVQTQRRKPLKFTVGMIRDQDKLLATMKQQGVPMDIMRRQFEILLNEQRKHLEYLELLWQQEESPVTKTVVTKRKRKEQDEKPEWMIHLTPSRLSYVEIEKMYEQRKKQREMEMIQQQQQSQQMASQMSSQQVPVQVASQQHWQQTNWQQQQRHLQNCNHMYSQAHAMPRFGNMNELMKSNANNPQSVQQYVHQQPHQQYYNPQVMQQYQQFYQTVPQQNQEQVQSSNQFSNDNRSSTEPSSLLKIRQYKQEIRPQKLQNGLQDPEAAKRILENDAVSSEIRNRLQYLANFAPKKPIVRLNGMQDYNEAEAEFQNRLITSTLPPAVKRISANGLENSRNPNNPPAQRLLVKKMEQEYVREYPRQKSDIPTNYRNVQAERENGTTNQPQLLVQQQLPTPGQQQQQQQQQQFPGQNSASVVPHNCGNVMLFRFDGNYPQHYQQMQQYCQNTRNLVRNNGEGDVGSNQGAEQNKGSFDHAGGDASHGNMTSSMNRQMAEGKVLPEKVYYGQPDIHESKTIGGVRYLARKQDYLPNQQIMIPETLVANRHAQIPTMS